MLHIKTRLGLSSVHTLCSAKSSGSGRRATQKLHTGLNMLAHVLDQARSSYGRRPCLQSSKAEPSQITEDDPGDVGSVNSLNVVLISPLLPYSDPHRPYDPSSLNPERPGSPILRPEPQRRKGLAGTRGLYQHWALGDSGTPGEETSTPSFRGRRQRHNASNTCSSRPC